MNSATPSLDRKTSLALVEASRVILGEMELQAVFQRIAEQAASVLGADCASVLLFDLERKQLVFQAAGGRGEPSAVGGQGGRCDSVGGDRGQPREEGERVLPGLERFQAVGG